MIFPIGDTPQPPRGFVAWVNWLLIAINVAVYLLWTLPLSSSAPDPSDPFLRVFVDRVAPEIGRAALSVDAWSVFIERWGYVPDRGSVVTLFTAMFMHANFAHIAGNMFFLWIYGDNVEHRIGRLPYLALYLASGAVATLAFAAFAADGQTPLVGASGAISGSLGAYFVMFPQNKVKLLVGLFPFLLNVWLVPARLVLGFYVLVDNLLPFLIGAGGGVAYGAHLGGFVAGLAAAFVAERTLSPAAPPGSADAQAQSYLEQGDRLAEMGQDAAAFRRYLLVLELTEDPYLTAQARRGIRRLRLDPRLAERYRA